MTRRITHTYEFSVESDSGKERVIVCSEDCAERGSLTESQNYYVPTGPKTYKFKGGERAAKIGELFLDSSGEIYRSITSTRDLGNSSRAVDTRSGVRMDHDV
jgi:hypothetical protein